MQVLQNLLTFIWFENRNKNHQGCPAADVVDIYSKQLSFQMLYRNPVEYLKASVDPLKKDVIIDKFCIHQNAQPTISNSAEQKLGQINEMLHSAWGGN